MFDHLELDLMPSLIIVLKEARRVSTIPCWLLVWTSQMRFSHEAATAASGDDYATNVKISVAARKLPDTSSDEGVDSVTIALNISASLGSDIPAPSKKRRLHPSPSRQQCSSWSQKRNSRSSFGHCWNTYQV